MNNVVNQIAYLRTTREFPEELDELRVELSKSYIDTSNAVNARTIGIFPVNVPAITGEGWYLRNNRKQQSLRRVFTFTATTPIAHGLTLNQIDGFSRLFGTYTNGSRWYGLIAASDVAIAGQVSFYIDATNIVILVGAGAPTLTSGRIVLEWLSNP